MLVVCCTIISKRNHIGITTLFGPFRNNMCKFASKLVTIKTYCLDFIKIISIPDEEYFSETVVGRTVSKFVKLYDVPVGFVTPPH